MLLCSVEVAKRGQRCHVGHQASAELPPRSGEGEHAGAAGGVRTDDRQLLAEELHGELIAAAEAGQPPSSVLGEDVTETLPQWATGARSPAEPEEPAYWARTLLGVIFGSLVLVTVEVVEQ